jgi:ribosomal protein L11 methyltransferase
VPQAADEMTTAGRAGRDAGAGSVRTWLELSIAVDHEAVEAVSEILAREAEGGVSVEPGIRLLDEGLSATFDAARPVLVRAWLPGARAGSTADAVERIRTALGHLQAFELRPIGELQVSPVRETDWAAQGRSHFPVLRIGERFVVKPTWRRYRPAPGDIVLALDPGVAFGTGLHPTTRLCLLGLEAWGDEGRVAGARVLDVGSGSGILSLGAARLGGTSVLGIDTDPLAAEATASNARRNRLSRSIRSREGSVPTGEQPFDLVLANLVASVLVPLAAGLYAEVRSGDGRAGSGGRILASGIIAPREAEVRRAFAAAGFHLLRRWEEGDWVAIEAERVA